MAKVYSWFLGKGEYAYIANPTDLSTYHVGAELTGDALQTVKDWAQNCSDTDYDEHFNDMVKWLNDHNYGVEFDSSETYRTMDTTCDNLRGPAGRGIVSFRELSADTINNATVYVVTYDDGTSNTFNVYNGKPGRDGRDGNDGADGDVGISTRTVFVYASGKDGEPARPVGGSWNFLDGKIEYPDGWTADDKVPGPVFMSSRTFASNSDAQDKEWSYPVQISGENGTPGADGTSIEFIYQRFSSPEVDKPDTSELPSPNENDYIPNGWKDSPEGVDEDNKVEYVSTRKKDKTTGVWGPWSTATIWSQYGTNGQDGDGIQYIYLRNKGAKPDNPTPLGYNDNESEFYADYQNKENEWVPTGEYYNIDVPSQKIVITDDNKWTDNPLGVTEEFQYEWVAQRKYRKGSGDTEQMWQAFSSPTLWAKYGESGSNGTSVRTMYCCTDSTGDEPAVDRTNLLAPGGDWQAGFPEDYVNGKNVVWGITAVIYGHNNTFVDPEKGWEGPFLVTGTKGIDGTPMDYNTIAFCYAPKDYPPAAPNANVEQDNLGSSLDGLGIYRQWYDFPDTTNVGLDGDEVDGFIMRWYQCAGTVDSAQGTVFKWGAVVPNSPMDGETLPGKYMEFRFAVTPAGYNEEPELISIDSATGKPIRYPELRINNKQVGWYTTSSEGLPKMDTGCTMWQIYTWIDGSTNEVVYNDKEKHTWYGPQRVSGEKGDKGDTGPIGKRGVTGLPGATVNLMYCLGNEDEPYGTDEWKPFEGMTYGQLKEQFDTWYEVPPTASVIKVSSQEEFESKLNPTNAGCLVQWYEATTENISGTSMNVVTKDTCYLISKDGSYSVIEPERIKKNEEGQILVYIWCIQGNDVWKKGEYDEDTDGDKVVHEKVGIEWCEPFRMQGVSGLRGISGSRGQVVYPMGIYNPNEVYITTEDKAPYVYDASDGLFYVLNVVNDPWVGQFPEAPADYTGETPYYQTIQYQTGFDENGNPTYAYKYEVNGQFLTHDQQGDWPANNYANKTNNDQAPAWVRFESFEALYTNVGIIENGMIGSAVYNNEFMFSQQGIDRDGNATDYAAQAKKAYDSGFLSAYEYDSDGKHVPVYDSNGHEIGKDFRNWKYRETDNYIADKDVDPYEVKTKENEKYLGGTKEDFDIKDAPYGTPIHSFRPNVCINFKTGEMWTSAGKVNFDVDGSGHLLDENILWYFGDQNTPVFQIGKDGEKGIRMSGSSMTIGVLEDYKKQVSDEFDGVGNRIDGVNTRLDGIDDTIDDINSTLNDVDVSLGNINKTITDLGTDLKEQIDGKCNTWYQSADPAIKWQNTDSSNTLSYVREHLGDMWFDTDDNKSYVFSEGDLKDGWKSGLDYKNIDSTAVNITGSHKYYWRVAAIPQELYDTFDGKANIFIDNPSGQVYHIGDLWIAEKDYASNITFADSDTTGKVKKGVILIATSSADTQFFSYSHWSKKDRYTDDTTALAAKNQLNLWASDKVISPVERAAINDIGKQILAEYPALTGQAKEYNLNVVECSAYTAYTATTANATATTNLYGATASPNSGDSIIISSSTHTDVSTKVDKGVKEDYSNIEKYYDARAGLQNIITNTVYSKANAAAHSAYTEATAYTKTQVNTITSTTKSISDSVTALQGDVDGKAQMFSQANDPSSGFGSTNAEIDKHLGDIWYNTTSSTTQYFSNTTAGIYTSATKTGYYWVRTDLALEVFDYSDGKSALYTVANPTGYSENDLWIIPSSQTSGLPSGAGVGDTVVCTNAITANTATGKTSGGTVYAKTYRAADWSKLDKYTDDSYAKTKFADWAQDGYLSPAERESLKREGEAITKDFNGITGHTYYNSCASSAKTNFQKAYTAATCAITYHTAIQDNDKTIPVKIETGTNKSYGYGWITNFHTAKETIRQHIDGKIKEAAYKDATGYTDQKFGEIQIPDTEFLTDVFGSVLKNDGATLTGYLGVTDGNPNSPTDHVVAYVDGKGITSDSNGTIMLATGIPTGTTALSGRATSATTKIYNTGKIVTKNADISGKISATSGKIGCFTIDDRHLIADNSTISGLMNLSETGIHISSGTGNPPHVGIGNCGGALVQAFASGGVTPYCPNEDDHIAIQSSSDKAAWYCNKGMFYGLRPQIKVLPISTSAYTATTFDHTIIMTKSPGEGGTTSVTIPKTPPTGQEYVIMQWKRHEASLEKNRSVFTISINGGGAFRSIVSQDEKDNSITWKGCSVECRLFFDGSYWWYTYNSWGNN